MYLSVKAYDKKAFMAFYELYKNYKVKMKPSSTVFAICKTMNLEITFYNNLTVLFKGNMDFDTNKNIDLLIDSKLYVGIDEVGIGESIGPFVACGAEFNSLESKREVVKNGIKDSKKMTLKEIESIVPLIKKNAKVFCVRIDNNKFNELNAKFKNVKIINAVAINSINKHFENSLNKHIVDGFTTPSVYKGYLEKNIAKSDISKKKFDLVQKSEDKYVEVAAAAIVAKSIFNSDVIKYCKDNNINLPLKDNINTYEIYKDLVSKNKLEFVKKWK